MSKATQNTTSKELKDYIKRFTIAYKKSAKNVIELATVIGETHASLSDKSFKLFCKEIGYTTRSSYVSKMKTIYANLDRFQEVKNALPGNYTTIYDLARMPIEQFNDLVANGKVTTNMRAPKVIRGAKLNTQTNKIVVKVKWDTMNKTGLSTLTNFLDDFAQKWGCTIELPKEIDMTALSNTQRVELDTALAANDSRKAIAA